jgi:hypothetical protein
VAGESDVENYSLPRGFKSSAQLAEENRQKAEKAKERQEAARRKNAEEEAEQARESADWKKTRLGSSDISNP